MIVQHAGGADRMLHLKVDDDGVAVVTLDRPPVNAWDGDQLDQLEATLRDINGHEDVALVVVQGIGQHFSAGGDIKMMESALDRGAMAELDAFAARTQQLFACWEQLDIPTVAVLRGAVLGAGLELALACDLRIAADTARIGLPEVGLGLVAAGGGTQRLTSLVGRGTALRLMLSGEIVDGLAAERLGLVQFSAPENQVETTLADVKRVLLSKAGPAQAAIKRCVRLAEPSLNSAGAGFAAELASQQRLHVSEQAGARIRGFVEARRSS
jgi:enoyl-CoA hydratase